jgi:hypothetical protein
MLVAVGFTFDPSTLPGLLRQVTPLHEPVSVAQIPWQVPDPYDAVGVIVRGPRASDRGALVFITQVLMIRGRWTADSTCSRATDVVFPNQFQNPVLNDCSIPIPGLGLGYFSVVHFTIERNGASRRYSIYVRNTGDSPTPNVSVVLRNIVHRLVFERALPVG